MNESLIRQHQRQNRHPFLIYCALVTASALLPATFSRPACAAEVRLVPACEFKEEFNDNVFLTAGNRKSDFITTLAPSLAFSRNSERLKIDLLSGINWREYARSEGIGSTDYQYTAQLAGKPSQRDDLGIRASYVRNTRPDAIDQGTRLSASAGSDRYEYSASGKRVLNATTSASLAYSYVRNTYDNPAAQGNDVHKASLTISRDWGNVLPPLSGSLNTDFSRAIYSDSTNDSYTVSLGAGRNISPTLNIQLSVGGQLIHSTFAATSEAVNDSWGAVGSASLNYTGEKSTGSFSFARNFSAASGRVGAVETTTLGLTLGRNLSDKTTAQVGASYNINQASRGQFSSRDTDDRALNLKADVVYAVSRFLDLGVHYAYYNVTYGAATDSPVSQNTVIVKAALKYP